MSIIAEAHRALQQMSFRMSAAVGVRVTLSQVILIARELMHRDDAAIIACAQKIGIEPPADAS